MKRIDTLIHTARWDEASSVLAALDVPVTLREVKTFGRTPPRRAVYRGTAYYSRVTSELEITVFVPDAQLEPLLAALAPLAQGGEVFVTTVERQAARSAKSSPRAVTAPHVTAAASRAPAPSLRVAIART